MNETNRARELFGEIDIYLFDQVLKGRLLPGMRMLDAGCGYGRNLRYFFANGLDVCGVDGTAAAIAHLQNSAAERKSDPENFRVENVEKMSFADADFDAVISNAVLHFARDTAHFDAMLIEMWRVLKTGGLFFARLASDIGIEKRVQPIEAGGRWFHLPDGSDRYLVNEDILLDWTRRLGAEQIEPIKTVNVQNLRCMTTWVLRKK
jgi:tellurite methyltransferase